MTVTIPGHSSLTGNPETILNVMRDAGVFTSPEEDVYINGIKEAAQRLYGVTLKVEGSTRAERAESLLRSMAEHNMITIEEEAS